MRWERFTTFDLASARDATKDFVTSSMEAICIEKEDANELFEFCINDAAEDDWFGVYTQWSGEVEFW
ncbi:hypothetical protein ACLB2K_029651 [Fragaria x ananassa]